MKRFIKYFLCLLISLCVFAGTGCGFDVFIYIGMQIYNLFV